MKTIKEYKKEFIKLANEMEKDLGCTISDIYIRRCNANEDEPIDRCNIEF